MNKKELKKWIKELREAKYEDHDILCKKTHEFATLARRDKDELACAYAEVYFVILDFRANSISSDTIKNLVGALQVSEKYKDYNLQTETHNMLGIVVSHLVDRVSALEHYEKGYAIAKKHHLLYQQSIFANNIGDVYTHLEEYDIALDYFRDSYKQTLELEKKNKDKKASFLAMARINMCFLNMAEVYYKKADYDEAFRMLSCIDGFEYDSARMYFYSSLLILRALILIKSGETEQVSVYLDKIISEADNNVEALSTVDDYLQLASALVEVKEYEKAKMLLTFALKITEKADSVDKWCNYIKVRLAYLKAAEPEFDRTKLYEKYFECREKEEKMRKAQQLSALRSKKRLEEEIRKRSMAEERNRKLKALSEHDQLTGVYNRYAMNELGQNWFNEAKEKNTRISLMIIDIDYFKEYNDTYGHLGGDEALRSVSEVLKKVTGVNDMVVRYGGDEFFIISKGRTDEEIVKMAKDINAYISEKKIRHAGSLVSDYLTLSLGAVNGKIPDEQSMIDMIHLADNGLYRVKNETRNALGLFKQTEDGFEYECVKF